MTGVGKTSLAERLSQLLGYQDQYVRFDMGEYCSNYSGARLKMEITDKMFNYHEEQLIIVLDEFQLARTVGPSGSEVDRDAARVVWDLLDSGRFKQGNEVNYRFGDAKKLVQALSYCLGKGVIVKNGVVVENEAQYNQVMNFQGRRNVFDMEERLLLEEVD